MVQLTNAYGLAKVLYLDFLSKNYKNDMSVSWCSIVANAEYGGMSEEPWSSYSFSKY